MGLTKSQKYNKMSEAVFAKYSQHQNSLPACHLLSRFLEIAEEKLKLTKDEALSKYKSYTVAQWEELLKLGWKK